MAYTMNVKTLSIFLILFNYYNCQPPTPTDLTPPDVRSYLQDTLQSIPHYANELNIRRLLASAVATGIPPTMYAKTPREVILELGSSLQKVFDVFQVSPETCTYIINVMEEAQKSVGDFSSTTSNEYARATSKQFLQLIEGLMTQLPACTSPQNLLLSLLTKQLRKLPAGNLRFASDTVSGDDISTNLLQFLENGANSKFQPLSKVGKSLDMPMSGLMLEMLINALNTDYSLSNNNSFYNMVGRLGQGVKSGFNELSPYLTEKLQNQ